MICPICCRPLVKEATNDKWVKDDVYWICENCGVRVGIWSLRKGL